MARELIGLEFLQKNEIINKRCDMDAPFAFISYSHDAYDSQIVMNVFKALYNQGINAWIDTANMPYGEEDWKVSATKALMNHNCKFAFFFRSESSMLKSTIAKELETIKKLKHIGPIVTIDIWHDFNNNAGKFHDDILNAGNYDDFAICDKICGIVSTECKALRLASDMGNDIRQLIHEMYGEAVKKGVASKGAASKETTTKETATKGTITKETAAKEAPKETAKETPGETAGKETAVTVITAGNDKKQKADYISLQDFLKKYNNNNFKKDTFAKIRLVGDGEFARYSTDYFDSAFSLAWAFVMNLLSERGTDYINDVTRKHADLKNPVFITSDVYAVRKDQNKYRKITVKGLENYYMYRHYGQYQWIDAVLKLRLTEYGLPAEKFGFEYIVGGEAPSHKPDIEVNITTAESGGKEDGKTYGGITGPVTLSGSNGVQKVDGQFTLAEFLKKYDLKTFQSKSCKSIKLIGRNGCEKYSIESDADGGKIETARQLVYYFAMRRLDEMGMEYINLVNGGKYSKNPIFITEEDHKARKARKESVTYTRVISKSVSGYSMCTHYAEYDWLKNSLMKQLTALGLSAEDFYIILEQ